MALPPDASPIEQSLYAKGKINLATKMYQKRKGQATKPTPPTAPSRAPRVVREEIAARPKPIPPPIKIPGTQQVDKISATLELRKRQIYKS